MKTALTYSSNRSTSPAIRHGGRRGPLSFSSRGEVRDLLIAGIIGVMIIGKEIVALVAAVAFAVALCTAGLVASERTAITDQPRLISEVAR